MSDKPREWGPNDEGRWGNHMMQYRDEAAEQLVMLLRAANRLDALAREGQATRTNTLFMLFEIREAALIALMNLQKAGAPIDPTSLSLQQYAERDQSRGRE